MAQEVVTVGCRLPNGLKLEVGLQRTVNSGPQNRPVVAVKQLENYRSFTLLGTNAHSASMRSQGIQVPSVLDPQPFINPNVPKDLWDQWVKENHSSPLLKRREIYDVKNGGTANSQAASIDALATSPTPLTPLDRSKKMKFGVDTVETAEFDKD